MSDLLLFMIVLKCLEKFMGFPGNSVGKESARNAGDPGLIPGLGRSTGERDRLPAPILERFRGLSY